MIRQFAIYGEHRIDQTIPGFVLIELLSKPHTQFSRCCDRLIATVSFGRKFGGSNPIAPNATEMLAILWRCQQFVNQLRTLTGMRTVEISGSLVGRGNPPRQIEIDPAQELGFARGNRGSDFFCPQFGIDRRINALCNLQRIGCQQPVRPD